MREILQDAGWQAAATVAAAVVALTVVLLSLKFVRFRAWFPLAGAAVLLAAGIAGSPAAAVEAVPWRALALALTMGIIATAAEEAGWLQLTAVRFYRLTSANPRKMLAVSMILAASASALLDALTAMAALLPLMLAFTRAWRITPSPFVIGLMLACNLGSGLSVAGTMPARLIGTAGGLGLPDVWLVLGPLHAVLLALAYLMIRTVYADKLNLGPVRLRELQTAVSGMSGNRGDARNPAIALGLILLGYLCADLTGIDLIWISGAGAALVVQSLIKREESRKSFAAGFAPLLALTAGWLLIAGVFVRTGVLDAAAGWLMALSSGDGQWAVLSVLWMSAAGAALSDGTAWTAFAVPVVQSLGGQLQEVSTEHTGRLWYVLLSGIHLGANATSFSSFSSLLAFGVAAVRKNGLSFREYARIGVPFSLFSLTLASLYLVGFWFGNN
ncbi:SLC13 family permease [Paenibacillus sp. 1P03SA]|uniref:SLC13 family permease n=1 Tax=Paenibacillus sp. 1P03SA TaxID=3132294 RepID=UPI0039A148C5